MTTTTEDSTAKAIHRDLVRLAMEGVERVIRSLQRHPAAGPSLADEEAIRMTLDVFRKEVSERLAQIAGPLAWDRDLAVERAIEIGVREGFDAACGPDPERAEERVAAAMQSAKLRVAS